MRTTLTALVLAAVVALAGCSDPYARDPSGSSPTPSPPAATAPSPSPSVGDALPGPATPAPIGRPGARATRSPIAVARACAALMANWEWNTLFRQLERARRLTAGPLRTELGRTAAAALADESLRRDRPGSRGRVLSVAARGTRSTRQLVVVTSEQPLHAGRGTLEGPRAKVYTATARRTAAGWRLVAWEPQP